MNREPDNERNSGGGRRRSNLLIHSIEDLAQRNGTRLSRWMKTWDAVDHSLVDRLLLQANESRDASTLLPEALPLIDHIHSHTESMVSSAIERVEHLIVMCNRSSSSGDSN